MTMQVVWIFFHSTLPCLFQWTGLVISVRQLRVCKDLENFRKHVISTVLISTILHCRYYLCRLSLLTHAHCWEGWYCDTATKIILLGPLNTKFLLLHTDDKDSDSEVVTSDTWPGYNLKQPPGDVSVSVWWWCDGGRVVAGGGQTAASRWTLLLPDYLELSTGNFTISQWWRPTSKSFGVKSAFLSIYIWYHVSILWDHATNRHPVITL